MLYIENNEPYVRENYAANSYGLATAYPSSFGNNVSITGNLTTTGNITGPTTYVVSKSATVGATVVLTAAQSDGTFINVSTSGSPSWTLPAATTAGLMYTFICGNTTTGFTITGAQVIHAKTSATGTAITTTTTLTNTQATAVVGDAITLISDGSVWWMVSQTGIFAAS